YYVIKQTDFTVQVAEDLDHAVGNPDPDGDPNTDDAIPVTPLVLHPNKSDTDPDGPSGPQLAPTATRHFLVREGLGGLLDGYTYFVRQVSGDTFKLSTTNDDSNIITPVLTDRSGTSTLNRAGLK